jgi:hypothetical protein
MGQNGEENYKRPIGLTLKDEVILPEVTSMESLRYKEFCSVFEIAWPIELSCPTGPSPHCKHLNTDWEY